MRRIRIGRGWRWGLALGLVLLLVAGGLFYRSSLEQVALDAAAGAPATTRYPAPGDTVTSGTRRTRAPGRNRGRRNPSNTRGADGPAVRTIPAAPGGRADAAKVIVGLGDSVPAGANCSGCTTYVDEVGHRFAAAGGDGAVIYNHAVSGYTTGDLLRQLDDGGLKRHLARADLVILTIGANDLDTGFLTDPACAGEALLGCYAAELATVRGDLDRIEATVLAALKPGARLVVTGYWNVFTDGAVGRAEGAAWVSGSDALTVRANALIEEVTRGRAGTYVEVRPAFRGADGSQDITDLLADDGDHLNAAGHVRMADVITAALR